MRVGVVRLQKTANKNAKYISYGSVGHSGSIPLGTASVRTALYPLPVTRVASERLTLGWIARPGKLRSRVS